MELIDLSIKSKSLMDKQKQWQAVTGQSNMSLYDDGLEAAIYGGDVGGVRICRVSLGSHRFLHENNVSPAGDHQRFKFVFQEAGECIFEQDSRTATLRPGQWCLYDKSKPHHIHNDGFSRQITLMVSFDSARDDLARWEDHLLRSYPMQEGVGHILHTSLNASIVELSSLSEASRYLVGKALTNLAELALLDKTGISGGTSSTIALRMLNRAVAMARPLPRAA